MKLSIIIVNYNASEFLKRCLHSLYTHENSVKFEIIVVDNGSHDESCFMVRDEFPEVHLIEQRENLGFAKGNNIGIAVARGTYILLLNSDTQVTGHTLDRMVRFLDTHGDVAVVAPRLVYPDYTDQGVARTFPTPMNALFGRHSLLTKLFPQNKYARRYMLSRQHLSDELLEVDWVSGACLMVRKNILEEIGLLDEGFFMYWEDADLCFRIKREGGRVFCLPEVLVIHYEGKSSGKRTPRLIIEFNKSAYRYYRKHCIRHTFELMNGVAIVGLALRTAILLFLNFFKFPAHQA